VAHSWHRCHRCRWPRSSYNPRSSFDESIWDKSVDRWIGPKAFHGWGGTSYQRSRCRWRCETGKRCTRTNVGGQEASQQAVTFSELVCASYWDRRARLRVLGSLNCSLLTRLCGRVEWHSSTNVALSNLHSPTLCEPIGASPSIAAAAPAPGFASVSELEALLELVVSLVL
jgi:hypothetical protein